MKLTTLIEEQKKKDHFVVDIEKETVNNTDFRRVLFTSDNEQLVVMSIAPGDDAGLETHKDVAQFIRVESGQGTATFNGKDYPIKAGTAFVVPKGTEHNVKNTSDDEDLKLYTVYAPPNHKDGTVHKTKDTATKDE